MAHALKTTVEGEFAPEITFKSRFLKYGVGNTAFFEIRHGAYAPNLFSAEGGRYSFQ